MAAHVIRCMWTIAYGLGWMVLGLLASFFNGSLSWDLSVNEENHSIVRLNSFEILDYSKQLRTILLTILVSVKGILPRSFGTRISRLYTRTTDVIM